MQSLTFNLPFPLTALNVRLRLHWSQRGRDDGHLKLAVLAALGGPRYLPASPYQYARVTVMQRRLKLLDVDAVASSAKSILDILQPASRRHPLGIGIIAGDDPAHCILIATQTRAAHRPDQRTIVVIEELPGISDAAPDLFAASRVMAGAGA